ncbi:MAG TPA: YfhO family protein, partial [Candidatus Kapabacteria bacterium]
SAEKAPVGPENPVNNGSWKLRYPFLIYSLFLCAVYWPVFLKMRFFWEDFMSQEYPIREFCYYMAGIRHALPFWNPYQWAWEPLLADPQNGFWYLPNLLQIAFVRIFIPSSAHLPILVPEVVTLLHLPVAALGMFYLLRKHFFVRDWAALLAGFAWGFGSRMAAEQNHGLFIVALCILPWAASLTMQAWSSWKSAIGLGLLLGFCFLGSQPQAFLFETFFLGAFTVSESFRRARLQKGWRNSLFPIFAFSLALPIATGISAIQLLPSLELIAHTVRNHFSYAEAAFGSLRPDYFGVLLVPKFFGENPGFLLPHTPIVRDSFWWWEGAFYWGVLPEILAAFGVVYLWGRRKIDRQAQHLFFLVGFALFAILYGMGKYTPVQEFFWRFVPLFGHFRAPNRMMWFLVFIGCIFTGIGTDLLLKEPSLIVRYRKFFLAACALFLVPNFLAILGVIDRIIGKSRPGLFLLLIPTFLTSVGALFFFLLVDRKIIRGKTLLLIAGLLFTLDLGTIDLTWYRNTVNTESMIWNDSNNSALHTFQSEHGRDHSKLFWAVADSLRKTKSGTGMFLRLPVEYLLDTGGLRELNPLCLKSITPPARTEQQKENLLGVSATIDSNNVVTNLSNALPFVKLYYDWRVVKNDSEAARLLDDSAFDIERTLYLTEAPDLSRYTLNEKGNGGENDTVSNVQYDENRITVHLQVAHPALLFINDLYYPAWKAKVDGIPVPTLRAFSCLRAIPVSPGKHIVEMKYESAAFEVGWKITVATLLIAFMAFVFRKRKQGKHIKQKAPPVSRRGPPI